MWTKPKGYRVIKNGKTFTDIYSISFKRNADTIENLVMYKDGVHIKADEFDKDVILEVDVDKIK